MANILFEELGGKYERKGDYLVPCIALPAEEEQPMAHGDSGIWTISSNTAKLYTPIFSQAAD